MNNGTELLELPAVAWLLTLKRDVRKFLSLLKGKSVPGYYRYSLSGDTADEKTFWGLANTVFAAKIHYMIDDLSPGACGEMADFIRTFQKENGIISDPYLHKIARSRRWSQAVKNRNFSNVLGRGTKRAETRQSFAALRCLNEKPQYPYLKIPSTPDQIRKYIRRLNWRNPWDASSHVSHLLFFLRHNHFFFPSHCARPDELINLTVDEAHRYRQADGSWYLKDVECPLSQKINSAMKILTGLDAAKVSRFLGADSLIDLCLSGRHTGNACNNLNVVYVLFYCCSRTDHRRDEIKKFCLDRLSIYQSHFWPEFGGFSFYERKANSIFYDARVSEGKGEPDIHGTVLLLWGITMIISILELNGVFTLKLPFT